MLRAVKGFSSRKTDIMRLSVLKGHSVENGLDGKEIIKDVSGDGHSRPGGERNTWTQVLSWG